MGLIMELLIGLEVTDETSYAHYRAQMLPILARYGGSFGIDVRVSEVLKSTNDGSFNRLFTLRFPSLTAHDAFFADPEYRSVRRRSFEPSVARTMRLGRYEPLA